MRSIHHVLTPLAFGAFGLLVLLILNSRVAQPSNLYLSLSPHVHQILATRDILPSIHPTSIDKRAAYGQPAQKILNGCPQWFNVPPLDCSLCGGESPTGKGLCSKPIDGGWQCQCEAAPVEAPIVTTVVTTIDGVVATGIFELETLTQYSNLREHIKIFTTASIGPEATDIATTTTGAASGVETVAAVVVAGGFAWFLAEYIGTPEAAAALKPNPDSPKKQDDKTCPNPRSQCSDCGGTGGMCVTGSNAGCGCEETSCPAEGAEDQPHCSDEIDCGGKDGKCTRGEHEGCDCKQLECPDLKKDIFHCADCGGADEHGKCKGDPELDYEFKGCDCAPDIDFSKHIPGLKRPNFGKGLPRVVRLPDIKYNSPAEQAPPAPTPQCDSHKSSRVPWNVFDSGVYNSKCIHSSSGYSFIPYLLVHPGFCNSLNAGGKSKAFAQSVDVYGKVLTAKKERRVISGRAPPNPKAYESFIFDLKWSGGDGSCSSDCSKSFYTIADGICGHTAGLQTIMATEASLDTGCGTFSYKITSPSTDPVVVEPTRADEWLCNDPGLTFNRDFTLSNAEKAVEEFCTADFAVPDTSLPIVHLYAVKDMNIRMQIGWRRAGQDGCGSIKNANKSRQSGMSKEQCSEYLLKAVNNCDIKDRKKKHGGTYMWSSPIGCVDFTVLGEELQEKTR